MESQLRQPGFARNQGEDKWASGGRVAVRSLPPLLNRAQPPSQLRQPGFARASSHAPLLQAREVSKEHALPPLPRPAVSAPITVWREPSLLTPGVSLDPASVTMGAVDARHRSRSQRSLTRRLEPLEMPPQNGSAQVEPSHLQQSVPTSLGPVVRAELPRKRSLGRQLEPLDAPARGIGAQLDARHGHVPCPPAVHTDIRQTARRRSSSRKKITACSSATEDQMSCPVQGRSSSRGQRPSRQHSRELQLDRESQAGAKNQADCLPADKGSNAERCSASAECASADLILPRPNSNAVPDTVCEQLLSASEVKVDCSVHAQDMVAVTGDSTASARRNPAADAEVLSIHASLSKVDANETSSKEMRMHTVAQAEQNSFRGETQLPAPETAVDSAVQPAKDSAVDASTSDVMANTAISKAIDAENPTPLSNAAIEVVDDTQLTAPVGSADAVVLSAELCSAERSLDFASKNVDNDISEQPSNTVSAEHAQPAVVSELAPQIAVEEAAAHASSATASDDIALVERGLQAHHDDSAAPPHDAHTVSVDVQNLALCADVDKGHVDDEAFYVEHREALIDAIRHGGKFQRRGEGGVGLLNQGATCYMNSLLQALFHTPEFRLVLYRFQYDASIHGEAARSIPLQLQRLFSSLQLSSASAISTKALTVACGFTAFQAREQHDVQELCRVLFDALERSASVLSAEIAELYAGRVTHYVRSREEVQGRTYQSRREEKFLDLQVPIQGCRALEDALRRLVEPEVLDGDNRWLCDELGEKVDALKGMEFNELPKIFCLQLLRFVFDLTTMRRVKLNDALSIPLDFDLGRLLLGPASNARYELAAACLHRGTAHGGHYHALIREAHTNNWLDANDSNVRILSPEEMKSLFSARGVGAREAEVNSEGRPVELLSSDAYFLIYRAVGLEAPRVEDADVPDPHRCELLHENARLGNLQRAYDIHRSLVQVTIFAPSAVDFSLRRHAARQLGSLAEGEGSAAEPAGDPPSVVVTIPGSRSVLQLVNKARSAFTKEAKCGEAAWEWAKDLDNQDITQVRLRQYDYMHGEAREPLDISALVSDAVGRANGFSQTSLLLEVCPAGMHFEAWDESHIQTVVCRWNQIAGRPSLETGDVLAIRLPPGPPVAEPPLDVDAEKPGSISKQKRSPLVGNLRQALIMTWSLELQVQLALVPLSGSHAGEALVDDSQTLAQCGVTTHDVLCAEVVVADSIQSVLLYERMRNTVHLSFNHPDRPECSDSFKISISKSAALQDLKQQIADILGLNHEELHLRRAQKTPQLKDETKTLRQVGLADSDSVFVGNGAPCAADECLLQVLLYTNEKGTHKTQEAFVCAARGSSSVRSLREAMLPRILEWAKSMADSEGSFAPFKLEGLTWKRLRLRDGQAGKHFTILRDERTLRSTLNGFNDGRLVAVQVLDMEEELTPDDMIFAVRPWRVREERLHAPTEFMFNKTRAVHELIASLTERLKGLLENGSANTSAETEGPFEKDRLELMALPTTGMPITIKRLAAMKWAECELNQDDPDMLAKPLSALREFRDGVTLVVRSRLAAALAPASALSPKAKAKVVPKPGAHKPFASAPGVVRKERNLVIEVVCPERLPQQVDDERGLVIDVACPEVGLQSHAESNLIEEVRG